MASKRQLRRKQCGDKVRHAKLEFALIAARKAGVGKVFAANDTFSAYACPHCGGFHIGHRPTPNRRTRRSQF